MSPTGNDPWTEALDKELDDSRKEKDPLQVQNFYFDRKVIGQFVKVQLVTWYGLGGGFQYFDILRKGISFQLNSYSLYIAKTNYWGPCSRRMNVSHS